MQVSQTLEHAMHDLADRLQTKVFSLVTIGAVGHNFQIIYGVRQEVSHDMQIFFLLVLCLFGARGLLLATRASVSLEAEKLVLDLNDILTKVVVLYLSERGQLPLFIPPIVMNFFDGHEMEGVLVRIIDVRLHTACLNQLVYVLVLGLAVDCVDGLDDRSKSAFAYFSQLDVPLFEACGVLTFPRLFIHRTISSRQIFNNTMGLQILLILLSVLAVF